jgi:hypothetical protein
VEDVVLEADEPAGMLPGEAGAAPPVVLDGADDVRGHRLPLAEHGHADLELEQSMVTLRLELPGVAVRTEEPDADQSGLIELLPP